MMKTLGLFRLVPVAISFISVIMAQSAIAAPVYDTTTVRLDDNSDWWSRLNFSKASNLPNNLKPQERKISSSNFQILGIKLDECIRNTAMAKLGKATIVLRGDAGTGRTQICYASIKNKDKVYLVFEEGELDTSFYLFTDGSSWKGNNYATNSNLISRDLMTASGLRLGQTPEQVIAILGKPNIRRKNELYYWLQSKEKRPEKEIIKLRQEGYSRRISNKKFHEAHDFYYLGVYIDAKFLNSKLICLAVSKEESI